MMAEISNISTDELIKDYLESYMDMARCELAKQLPEFNHDESHKRSRANRMIVSVIVEELANRHSTELFDERHIILGAFSI